jgi:hypothetical protein
VVSPTKQRPLFFSHECVISPIVVDGRRSPRLFLPLGAGRAAFVLDAGRKSCNHRWGGSPFWGTWNRDSAPVFGPMKIIRASEGGSVNTSESHRGCEASYILLTWVVCGSRRLPLAFDKCRQVLLWEPKVHMLTVEHVRASGVAGCVQVVPTRRRGPLQPSP